MEASEVSSSSDSSPPPGALDRRRHGIVNKTLAVARLLRSRIQHQIHSKRQPLQQRKDAV